MKRRALRGIIFACILLAGLMAACANKDKPEEPLPAEVSADVASKAKLGDEELTTKAKLPTSNEETAPKGERQKGELPKLVLIVTTQACHCVLDRCDKGEKIANKVVQQFPGRLTLELLDQAREGTAADSLVRRYRVHYLPALLFFDGEGNFRGKLEAFWDEGTVVEKLIGIGVE